MTHIRRGMIKSVISISVVHTHSFETLTVCAFGGSEIYETSLLTAVSVLWDSLSDWY